MLKKRNKLFIDISTSSVICALKEKGSLKVATNIPHYAFKNNDVNWDVLKTTIIRALSNTHLNQNNAYDTYVSLPNEKSIYQMFHINLQMLPLQDIDMKNIRAYLFEKKSKKNCYSLHFIPIESKIDNVIYSNPIGISGNKLSIKFHTICVDYKIVEFIQSILNSYNLDPLFVSRLHIVSTNLIPKLALQKGMLFINFDQLNTSFEINQYGKSMMIQQIPIGDRHIVHDIAHIIKVSNQEAMRIKIDVGRILTTPLNNATQASYKDYISAIMTARIEEILDNIITKIGSFLEMTKIQYIFITGPGLTNLGIEQYIEHYFNINTYAIRYSQLPNVSLPGYFISPIIGMDTHIPDDTFLNNKDFVNNATISFKSVLKWIKNNF